MGNIEKKNDNIDKSRFRDRLKSLRDSILWKKDSVESVSHETVHKSELLQWSIIDTALWNLDNAVDKNIESTESTNETKSKLNEIKDNVWKKEKNRQTTKYHIDRDKQVREWILESAKIVEDDYKNWENEQDPFAKNLLRFTNWIMKSEK